MNPTTREPAVAGTFYPPGANTLTSMVDGFVRDAPYDGPTPLALIAPHAGYAYSGPVAGTAYAGLASRRGTVERVLVLGPAHRVAVAGMALPSVDAFRTPIGPVNIDAETRERVRALPEVVIDDVPHAPEHSLEVHLPFLQRTLGDVPVLPVVVGHASVDAVARLVEACWTGSETFVVVSTDLSHYEDHASATAHDARTVAAIVGGNVDAIGPYDACGAVPVRALLTVVARRGLEVRALDIRNSGDTAGPRDRVVGYGAFAVVAP